MGGSFTLKYSCLTFRRKRGEGGCGGLGGGGNKIKKSKRTSLSPGWSFIKSSTAIKKLKMTIMTFTLFFFTNLSSFTPVMCVTNHYAFCVSFYICHFFQTVHSGVANSEIQMAYKDTGPFHHITLSFF